MHDLVNKLTSVFSIDVVGKNDQVIDRPRFGRFFLGSSEEFDTRSSHQNLTVEAVSDCTVTGLKIDFKN